jgi:hypothetical protein
VVAGDLRQDVDVADVDVLSVRLEELAVQCVVAGP